MCGVGSLAFLLLVCQVQNIFSSIAGEATLFEEGIRKHGKEFLEIQQEYVRRFLMIHRKKTDYKMLVSKVQVHFVPELTVTFWKTSFF